jgi:dihydroorotate dehydrogenase electron transfer subunit
MKEQIQGKVLSQDMLADGVYSMWIEAPSIAGAARPGQFVTVYCKDASRLLPRPISICEAEEDKIRLVYRLAGEGTREFSAYKAGDAIRLQGPLGNGFPIKEGKAVLIGGGIGVPPMVQLAKTLPGSVTVVSGYRNNQLFLKKDLEKYASVLIATEDGSAGTRGNVIDAMMAHEVTADVIYACGPAPMLRAIKNYAAERGILCYLSMEERMACGIGACLACVCKTKAEDEHTHVHNTRVCKDGPVFLAEEVEL